MPTKIEWTEETWNPVTGCTEISPGCDNCYARRQAERFAGGRAFPNGFQVTVRPERLDQPLKWRRPRTIFVCSMADLLHSEVPDAFIIDVFTRMWQARRHTFQVLTKRPARLRTLAPAIEATLQKLAQAAAGEGRPVPPPDWPLPNVWIGVSVEDQTAADTRIPHLLRIPTTVRFISAEPLLESVDLTRWLADLDWVIVGGESGPRARPMHPDWARQLRDQCELAGVPFFFKQWGLWRPTGRLTTRPPRSNRYILLAPPVDQHGRRVEMERVGTGALHPPQSPKDQTGRELDGRIWNQMPAVAV